MFRVAIVRSFSSAHRLRGYKGKCEALHGHNWKVEFVARAPELDALGMVIDFAEFKRCADEVLAPFDHVLLNEVPPFDRINPSSENMARELFDRMAGRIDDGRVTMAELSVWESDNSRATYRP